MVSLNFKPSRSRTEQLIVDAFKKSLICVFIIILQSWNMVLIVALTLTINTIILSRTSPNVQWPLLPFPRSNVWAFSWRNWSHLQTGLNIIVHESNDTCTLPENINNVTPSPFSYYYFVVSYNSVTRLSGLPLIDVSWPNVWLSCLFKYETT